MQDFWKCFRREPDGSWTCIAPATLDGPSGRRIQVAPGSRFVRGTVFMGVDLAEWLDANADSNPNGAGRAGSPEKNGEENGDQTA